MTIQTQQKKTQTKMIKTFIEILDILYNYKEYVIYAISVIAFCILSNNEQKAIFNLFFLTFAVKILLSFVVSFVDHKVLRFALNNLTRIIQFLVIGYFSIKYIYKDRRCIIPILVLSSFTVVYFVSSLLMFINDKSLQIIIFNYRYLFGFIIIASLVDYGNIFYDKLFNNRYIDSESIGRIFNDNIIKNMPEIKGNR